VGSYQNAAQQIAHQSKREAAKGAFHMYDADHSGKVDPGEFHRALTYLGCNISYVTNICASKNRFAPVVVVLFFGD
jgi:hypothetical protein